MSTNSFFVCARRFILLRFLWRCLSFYPLRSICCLPLSSFIACAWVQFLSVCGLWVCFFATKNTHTRRILISLGLLFIPTEKNRFITCNLINFLISSLFLRCVSSPFFRCHCVCSFCAVRAIVSAVACLREMLNMKWMWFHSSRVSWRVFFFTHSAKWWTCSVDGIVSVRARRQCGGGQRRTHVEPLP